MADDGWLGPDQARAWLAYMRVSLQMSFEMNRQLAEDHAISLADYTVLVALSNAPGGRQQLSDLAAEIGWERSRLSHHLRRMEQRGLTQRARSERDGRATDAVLSGDGRAVLERAAPDHARLVRALFFDGMTPGQVTSLAEALEAVHDHLVEHGTLPPPPGA